MNRNQKVLHGIFSATGLFAITIFALYWFRLGHIPHNYHGWARIGDILLFLAVTYILWLPVIMKVLVWSIASHIRQVKYVKAQPGMRVAFITTFVPASESISLLEKTLPAMVNAHYTHDTWLLDEGNDPAVKALCKKYGVQHFSRAGIDIYNEQDGKFARKTKGGNHNSWYDTAGNDYDIVAQIDTDFIPHVNFLERTLGYFRDPKIAFVGTPQVYGNTKGSLIARGAAQQTFSFYGPILRGMDGMDTTLLIGANHVIRVSALKSVDHYSAHITEDLLTGMKLHSAGWKSVYVPEVLAIGEGPLTWKSYFAQQKRWAYGCMHILFNHSFKLFRGMSLRRRVYYFLIQQHYFTGVAMALSTICLSLYFLFGIQSASLSLDPFLSLYVPILIVTGLMSFWLQRFNIRPKKERGIMFAGMYMGIAAWPIFLLAFISLLKRKKMAYKVTPKGIKVKRTKIPIALFIPHLFIGLLIICDLVFGLHHNRHASVMVFWAVVGGLTMLFVPVAPPLLKAMVGLGLGVRRVLIAVNHHYKIFEFGVADSGILPAPPTDEEKYLYTGRHLNILTLFSIISFATITSSMILFLLRHHVLWALGSVVALNLVYFLVSTLIDFGAKTFDLSAHNRLIGAWKPSQYPSVDVFLPNAGEALEVLENTWKGVAIMLKHYQGEAKVYCLDDADRPQVKVLAERYGFIYKVRPDRGYYKKAGNLRHGFRISSSDLIVIFDADFVPRHDFLHETLPYFNNPELGILQTPQYFNVLQDQNWLERGAGAVQELFYRFSQVSRNSRAASICVGSNAVYRRTALKSTGGTALIEHSEDVHTGFNLRMKGWDLQYIPIIVAKGLCPAAMPAFFKQQYRWCLGSMSMLTASKFWHTKLAFKTRLSYISGFLYYINTGLLSFYTPIVPLLLLAIYPYQISLINYGLVLPSFIFTQIIFPTWHRSTYGIEAWATRMVYGWAHLFAISDSITNNAMHWQPTGTKAKKDMRYIGFRTMQFIFNFIPAVAWISLATYHMLSSGNLAFAPITISGLYYLLISAKVTFYTTKPLLMGKSFSSSKLGHSEA